MTLKIEITSDFICPWCLVAETRLNKAIKRLNSDVEIEKIWHPYELNPTMPEAGMDRQVYRSTKFGSWEYSQQLDRHTIEATKNDGIDFRYDLMEFTPNTFKAHRLTWFAQQQGKGTEMAERIFQAYFIQGQNISEVETLVGLAGEVGIDTETAKRFLLSDEGVEEVKNLEHQAVANGTRGVPSIRIGERIRSGAQPVEAFIIALKKTIHELAEV
ncbi:MAG: DsbA family oxidoreductase [Cyanobacteria bacterium J06638_38]